MGRHTAGGWSRNIKPASKYSCIFAGRNTHVAYLATSGLPEDEIEANCNLIAAAPALLAALQDLLHVHGCSHDCAVCDEARAAIARAKGGQ